MSAEQSVLLKQVIPVFIVGKPLCFILKQKHLEVFPRENFLGIFLGGHLWIQKSILCSKVVLPKKEVVIKIIIGNIF